MSNSEGTVDNPLTKVALKCNDSIARDKQIGVKRPFSAPQSPLKIEQQRRNEAFGSKVCSSLFCNRCSCIR